MSKIEEYKKSTRKAHKVVIEKAKGGYLTHTHFGSGMQDTSIGKYTDPELAIHKGVSSLMHHIKSVMPDDGMEK